MANGHGGARPGAGRKPRREQAVVDALAATLIEMAIGQSNVSLELDSKSQVKPSVSVYGKDVASAGKTAEAEFDRLMAKYHPKTPAAVPTTVDAFSDDDLALLGLKRLK